MTKCACCCCCNATWLVETGEYIPGVATGVITNLKVVTDENGNMSVQQVAPLDENRIREIIHEELQNIFKDA